MHIRDRAVIGLLSLVLVGLTGAVVAPSLAPGGPGESPGFSAQPARPYVEGVVGAATTVSPFSAQTGPEREIEALLFRGLVKLGPGNTLIGDLADHWEVDESGASWTFHLRPNQFWQDGEPVTADDVVFTIGALSDPAYTGPGASSWREVTVSSPDPSTVTLSIATPLAGFLQAATQPIAPAHLLGGTLPADLPADSFGARPVGSSSFRLAELDAAHALLLPSSPEVIDQAGGGGPLAVSPPPTDSLGAPSPQTPGLTTLPYLEGIEFRFFPDTDALVASWHRGELDGAAGLPAGIAGPLSVAGAAHLVRYPGTTLLSVALNLRPDHREFSDPLVRRALLEAIDRDAIVADALGGLAVRADAMIPPTSWAFDPVVSAPVPYDAGAAIAALTKAGWKRSAAGAWIPKGAKDPLTIEIIGPTAAANPSAFAVADAITSAWRAIGLIVTHTGMSGAELVGQRLQTGNFSAAVIATGVGLDPDIYPLLASTQATSGGSNVSGLQDPPLDKLLAAARAPGTDEARKAAYAALQERLAAWAYMLPVAFPDTVVVVRDTLTGPQSRPVGGPGDRFWDVLTWRLADGR